MAQMQMRYCQDGIIFQPLSESQALFSQFVAHFERTTNMVEHPQPYQYRKMLFLVSNLMA
ncbi:hypothetical protein C2W62_30750 [Candidatus Entotheonella serta]|nr:hypothetical protein C2W62_30750 [Candidatus Entotheonella serta]